MNNIDPKIAALFKKAYHYNWDQGLAGLKKLLKDPKCDLATAKMIFWHGQPSYYYNHEAPDAMQSYEQEAFGFLKALADDISSGKYPISIGYAVEDAFLPATLGNIPAQLAEPVAGIADYKTVLYPNSNPFQKEVLALCQKCNSITEMEALAEAGADFSLKILNGYALPLPVAINHGQVEAVRYFAKHGFDLKAKVNKVPLLFGAVFNGHPAMVEFLIGEGIDPNQRGDKENTVLHELAHYYDDNNANIANIAAAASMLIAKGGDRSALNSKKKTPIDFARQHGNTDYERFLNSLP